MSALIACPCCGLIQRMPVIDASLQARCARCRERLRGRRERAEHGLWTASFALGALILFPPAIALPMLRIERFGRSADSSIIEGVTSMLSHGEWIVGTVVLVCSIVFPLTKLLALLFLTARPAWLSSRHRARTYQFIEMTGRWGMLDVLLVAVLVAVLKLGDLVDVRPGPAAVAFATVVTLSLLASASFQPQMMWDDDA